MHLSLFKILLSLLLALTVSSAVAKDDPKQNKKDDAKALSGISIVGNKEAPKSLFIVPWKSSELGVETGLASKLLDEKMKVVDKDVFERELDFYSSTIK
ncbi:MAG: hypothetical protein P8Y28_02850 [Gammaproteobacteria bacterium]|jgi:hypothetical protein